MSSFVRTLEKRIMKAAGIRRRQVPFQHSGMDKPVLLNLITGKDGEVYGLHFPRLIPAQFMPRFSRALA